MQRSNRVHAPSVVQLLIGGFGFMFFLTGAAGMFAAGLIARANPTGLAGADSLSFFTLGWMALAICLLLIPSIGYAILRLFGRDGVSLKLPNGFQAASAALAAWPLLILLGHLISTRTGLGWLILPPVQALAVLIPLWWLVELGRRGLRAGSPQRQWGILSAGIVVTPVVLMAVELLVLGALLVALVFWLASQPQLLNDLNRLVQRLATAPLDTETAMRILRPFLQRPAVIYAVFALLSGAIPLIEELLKPLGVWGLASTRITPAEGFVAGLLSGAAFALIETSGVLGGPGTGSWAGTVVGRTGTGLLHTVTAGLTGLGLAWAWSKGAFLRMAGVFLLAFLLHAVWNAFSILLGLAEAIRAPGAGDSALAQLSSASPYALGVLAVTMLVILFTVNRRLVTSWT